MTTEQLEELVRLTKAVHVTVGALTAIANGAPATATVHQDLAQLRESVEDLVNRIQDCQARVWLNAPSPAPPRRALPLSSEVPHGLHVRRHTVSGAPIAEQRTPPAISGKWQIGRLGTPRRPRSDTPSDRSDSPAMWEER